MSQSMPLNTFTFEGRQVRTITGEDGQPRWVARDIAEILGYAKASNPARLFAHVPEEWKGVNPIHTPSGEQEMIVLTEAGLFFFLGRSDKSLALPMQKWIAGEVLPAIRRTGSYSMPAVSVAPYPVEWKQDAPHKLEQARACAKGTYEVQKSTVVPALERLEAKVEALGKRPVLINGMTPKEFTQALNAVSRSTQNRREAQAAAHALFPNLIPAPPGSSPFLQRPLIESEGMA